MHLEHQTLTIHDNMQTYKRDLFLCKMFSHLKDTDSHVAAAVRLLP